MKWVKAYVDRHGRRRCYFRRPGFPSIPLAGEPGSKEFAEAYEAAMANAPRKIGEDRTEPGTFSALIADYYQTTRFKGLKEITRRTYRNALERFRKEFGDMPVRALTPRRLDDILDALAAKPGTQGTLRKVLRLILALAVRRQLIKVSPMVGVRLTRKAVRGFVAWSEADIAAFQEKWPSGSRERLALALLLFTGQRRSDVVRMGRQHIKGGQILVRQQKGGAELWIALHSELKAEIAAAPVGQLMLLTTMYAKPFSAAGFGNWFGEKSREAGLERRTAHGLRKAASRRLAEAGCTPSQIMAVTGHKNLSEVTLYTASVDQAKLAAEAIARTDLSTPRSPVRQNGQKPK